MSLTVCQTKRSFDTEFEATIQAARIEGKFNEEMEPYQCGTHWHITHSNPAQRRGVGKDYSRCSHCESIFKRAKMYKHKCKGKERSYGRKKEVHQSTSITEAIQDYGSSEAVPRVLPLGKTSEQTEIEGF